MNLWGAHGTLGVLPFDLLICYKIFKSEHSSAFASGCHGWRAPVGPDRSDS